MILADPLYGQRLLLRTLGPADATDRYLAWMHDAEVQRYLESRFGTHTLDSLRDFIRSCNESKSDLLLGICLADGRHIGNIKLGPVHPRHRYASIGLLIGERDCWGRGYAAEAIAVITRFGFESLGLPKLYAGLYGSNAGSLKAFVKAGYVEESRQKGMFECDGRREDNVQVGLTREDWEALQRGEEVAAAPVAAARVAAAGVAAVQTTPAAATPAAAPASALAPAPGPAEQVWSTGSDTSSSPAPRTTKLGLGTVQLGLDYGISNAAGRPDDAEVQRILATALQGGIRVLDTAAAYGDSESRLGDFARDDAFRIVTKLAPLPADFDGDAGLHAKAGFLNSLARLQRKDVDALLSHRAQDLLGPHGAATWQTMRRLRDDGRVQRIGCSVYGAAEIDALLAQFHDLGIVQLPLSLLDQRLLRSGHLDRLHGRGVEVHVRSLFLQGLLLMEPSALPPHFAAAQPVLQQLRTACAETSLTPLAAALAFVESLPQVACAVVGVNAASELEQILAAAAAGRSLPPDWFAPFALQDETILNPSLWPRSR